MAANIHFPLTHFWVLWEEQSPSCIRNCCEAPCDYSGTLGGDWCVHVAHHLAGTSLVPKWLCVYWNWNKFHRVFFFFQLEEQDSVLKDDFVLWCVKMCLLQTGVEVSGLQQSRKEKGCILSVHHLSREGSGMVCLCERCLLQGARSIPWTEEVELPCGRHRCSNPGSWNEIKS